VRKRYVLDSLRRQAQARADARALAGEEAGSARRRRAVLVLVALGVMAAAFAGWRAWFMTPEATVAAPGAPVPEHQRTGPLANPWGNEAPVNATRAEEAAAAASAAAATAAAAAAAASAAAGAEASAGGGAPPARDAVRQALARLRGGGPAAEVVNAALKGGDGAALVAVWMAERQCRQLMHWRQISEWRSRGSPNPGGAAAGPGPGPMTASLALCESMPESGPIEAALAAAGFPASVDNATELTRRPVDFAFAVAVGDPLLLADVLEASDSDRVGQQLRAWGADARDLVNPEVQRAAVWLASCTPLDAPGRPGGPAAVLAACKEHPAVWQACLHQGLCDVRDLRDLLLRSLSATEMGAVERIARTLAPRMGR